MCSDLIDTYVATCNQEIADYITSIGGKAIMTSRTHERASDRTEAMLKIEEELGYEVDIVVMVQGDEPMTTPVMISDALKRPPRGPFCKCRELDVCDGKR